MSALTALPFLFKKILFFRLLRRCHDKTICTGSTSVPGTRVPGIARYVLNFDWVDTLVLLLGTQVPTKVFSNCSQNL